MDSRIAKEFDRWYAAETTVIAIVLMKDYVARTWRAYA